MLYQPTPNEIAAIVARSTAKQPALATRWARAAAILVDKGQPLYWTGDAWHCTASDGTHDYSLTFRTCDCPDSDRRRDLVDGVAFCKHRLALLGLREICAGHMQSRLLGTYRGSPDHRALRLEPNAGLLIDNSGMILYCHDHEDHIPTPLCAFRSSPRGATTATEVDLFIFATWLATARPMSPAAAAGILFHQLIAAGRSRPDAAAAADASLIARSSVESDAAYMALCDAFDTAQA